MLLFILPRIFLTSTWRIWCGDGEEGAAAEGGRGAQETPELYSFLREQSLVLESELGKAVTHGWTDGQKGKRSSSVSPKGW